MSSFALANVLAVALCGGCMKIYPDEELPDLEVEWSTECPHGGTNVRVALYTWETHELAGEMTAPCGAGQVVFEDVAREQFRVEGYLLDGVGEVVDANQGGEADLRDGLSERLYPMYFDFANMKIGWQFEDGVSCASLGVLYVRPEIRVMGSQDFEQWSVGWCESTPWWTYFPASTYELRLRAVGEHGTVALSDPTPQLVVTSTERTDVGPLVLRRCDGACP